MQRTIFQELTGAHCPTQVITAALKGTDGFAHITNKEGILHG